MDNTILFKWEGFNENMATRYLLYELNINRKFARKQAISWADIKKHIFGIIKQISDKIIRIDEEINNIVFDLYGITIKEKEIIKNG